MIFSVSLEVAGSLGLRPTPMHADQFPPAPSALSIHLYSSPPREWVDGGPPLWFFPLAGEFRLTEPPHITGGLLCEEMGLGKTVEVGLSFLSFVFVFFS